MDNETLNRLEYLFDLKYREYKQLPKGEKAAIFFHNHVDPLSKELARLRAELEQQPGRFKALRDKYVEDMQRLERLEKQESKKQESKKHKEIDVETHRREKLEQQRVEQRKEFDAETRRLEKLRNEIGDSTKDEWQTLDHQIFSRYKNRY